MGLDIHTNAEVRNAFFAGMVLQSQLINNGDYYLTLIEPRTENPTTPQVGQIWMIVPSQNNNNSTPSEEPTESRVEVRTDDPVDPAVGRIWLRTDLEVAGGV